MDKPNRYEEYLPQHLYIEEYRYYNNVDDDEDKPDDDKRGVIVIDIL